MMVRFLGYCGSKVCEILHLPRLRKATLVLFYLKKSKGKRNPEGEKPALFAFESYLTGILTSLESFMSICRTVCQPVDLLVEPETVT